MQTLGQENGQTRTDQEKQMSKIEEISHLKDAFSAAASHHATPTGHQRNPHQRPHDQTRDQPHVASGPLSALLFSCNTDPGRKKAASQTRKDSIQHYWRIRSRAKKKPNGIGGYKSTQAKRE